MTHCPYCLYPVRWWQYLLCEVKLTWHRGSFKYSHARCLRNWQRMFSHE
jgi:hypothetical protein